MLGLILISVNVLLMFIYISLVYLPIISFMEKDKGIMLARKKMKELSMVMIKSLDIKLDVINKKGIKISELDRNRGIIFVANHQSNFDIPVLEKALEIDLGFVAKEEMRSWPFFCTWMKKSNCIFLNRENAREGIKDIKRAVEVAKSGYPTVIFPEGERTLSGDILEFKKGSFKLATQTDGIVVPVTIFGTYEIQKRGEWKMKRGQRVKVVIDAPIEVYNLSREEKNSLNIRVKNIIEENYRWCEKNRV